MKKQILFLLCLAIVSLASAQSPPPIDIGSFPPDEPAATPSQESASSVPTPSIPTESSNPPSGYTPSRGTGSGARSTTNTPSAPQVLTVPADPSRKDTSTVGPMGAIGADDSVVKLRVPTSQGTSVDVNVNRSELLSQLSDPSTRKNTYRFDRTPIVQVFSELATLIDKSFEAPPALAGDDKGIVPIKYLVSGVYRDMTPLEVFHRVAKVHGLRVREEQGVLRVFDESDIKPSELVAAVYTTKYVNLYNYWDSMRGFLSPKGRMAANAMNHQGALTIDKDGNATSGVDTKKLYGPINSGDPEPVALGSDSGSSSSSGASGGSSISGSSIKSDKDTTDAVMPNNGFSITLFDLPEVHEAVRDFIASIDKPKRQVAIQVRYYRFDDSPTMKFGADWSQLLSRYKINANFDDPVQQLFRVDWFKGLSPNTLLINPSSFSVLLSAIQSVGPVVQMAAPNAIAQHGQTTFMRAVTRRPILSANTSNTSGGVGTQTNRIEFLDIGTTLNVTPFILDDEPLDPKKWELYLDLRPEISRIGKEIAFASIGSTIPEVIAVAPTTSVRMFNGDTVLIGGLTDDTFERKSAGVPFLKDIPILGWLFGHTERNTTKSELVILVTGKILDNFEKALPNITEPALAQRMAQEDAYEQLRSVPVRTMLTPPNLPPVPPKDSSNPFYKNKNSNYNSNASSRKLGIQRGIPASNAASVGSQPAYEAEETPWQSQSPNYDGYYQPQPYQQMAYQGYGSGQPNYIRSPYAPEAGLVDVTGFHSGEQARCPYTGKIFIIP